MTQFIGEGVGGNANDRFRLSCQVLTSLTYIVLLTRGCSLVLGDLLRLWVRPEARVYTRPPDFQGQASVTPDAAPDAALYTGPRYLSPIQSGSGKPAPYKLKKRQLFPGLRPVSPGSIASQL